MSNRVVLFSVLLLAGCNAPSKNAADAAPPPQRTTAALPASKQAALPLPPEACTRDGYEAFFEAFVRNPTQRGALSVPGAPLGRFDIAMRDESWVQASNADVLLDIDEARSGDGFRVTAKPVERDENDEIVKVLGPARSYGFRYTGGCWKFATAD